MIVQRERLWSVSDMPALAVCQNSCRFKKMYDCVEYSCGYTTLWDDRICMNWCQNSPAVTSLFRSCYVAQALMSLDVEGERGRLFFQQASPITSPSRLTSLGGH